jgi:hypothetical protein
LQGGYTDAARSSTIPVTVAPTVSITSPANNATILMPASIIPADITINATASDSDGSVGKVEFFQASSKLGEGTASPYAYTWKGATAGAYTLTAKALRTTWERLHLLQSALQ